MTNEMAAVEDKEIEGARMESAKIVDRASELAKGIRDLPTLAAAADFLLEIKRKRRWWADWNKPAKQKMDALKRELLDRERQIDEPMERAENVILKPAIAKYQEEEDRQRRAEEDRQRAEARRKAEDEKIKQAAELERNGDKEAAEEMIAAPVVAAPVVVPKADAPAGIFYRDKWCFEITNTDIVPREYMTVDEQKIGGVVRALKGEARIAGVRVWSEKTVAGRI